MRVFARSLWACAALAFAWTFYGCLPVLANGTAPVGTEVKKSPVPDPQSAGGQRVSERLRHKDRVAAEVREQVTAPPEDTDGEPASGSQHNESDLEFLRRGAGSKRVPAHTPEWSNPKTGDPAAGGSARKGGTQDIDMGVGENQAPAPGERGATDLPDD